MSMFVAREDIRRYTGARTRDDQAKVLSQKGISFDVNPKGDILVLRSVFEQRLGGKNRSRARVHNIEALRKA